MDQQIVLQYLGFATKGALRERAISLRGLGGESSDYFVTMANEAFSAHRAGYQDAAEICSIGLQLDLSSPSTFPVTDAKLADCKDAYTPKAKRSHSKSAENEDF